MKTFRAKSIYLMVFRSPGKMVENSNASKEEARNPAMDQTQQTPRSSNPSRDFVRSHPIRTSFDGTPGSIKMKRKRFNSFSITKKLF